MKKFISLVLALVCVLGLVGCSNNQGKSEDENGTIVALVTATDTEYITIEITDAGNTNFEVGSNYTISVSDKLPTLGEGDYIRVVCNPSAVSQADISHIEEVISVNKTDKTGLSTAD